MTPAAGVFPPSVILCVGLLITACVTARPEDVVDTNRIETYTIRSGLDPMELYSAPAPSDWHPGLEGERLGLRLPYDWPERYRDVFGQFFNPWTYKQNVAALCDYAQTHGVSGELESLIEELEDRMLDHTVSDRGARFVTYDFEYRREEGTLSRGWVSAFGNGAVIASQVALHQCFGGDRHLEIAWEAARALSLLRGNSDRRWIAVELDDGSLWFEEYPYEDDPQARVLNGHIFAVFGLYYLYEETKDPVVLDLLRAGITAVERHGHRYRSPGEVNLYDLRPPDLPDYGPARTIHQQDLLCRMTGDGSFLEFRDLLASDMPEHAETLDLECHLSDPSEHS